MNIRSIIVIALALVSGVSAAVGVSQLRKTLPAAAAVETTPVLVVKMDVARSRMISADMVEIRPWPKEFVPANALLKIEDAVDRATIAPLLAGEVVLDGRLASKDSGRGLAALVPKGMRAYTVQTSRVAANVAGFILPGNRVDVLLSLHESPNGASGGGSTTTLLQAVEILAVDQRLDAPAENKIDPSEKGSVTLLVSPEQAALLDLGQSMGALTLSLRNLEDRDETSTRPATLADLRLWQDKGTLNVSKNAENQSEEAAEKKSAPELYQIRTVRGRFSGRVMVTH